MKGLIQSLIIFVISTLPASANALCAGPESPDKEFEKATAIFAGVLLESIPMDSVFTGSWKAQETLDLLSMDHRYTFQISKVWKGGLSEQVSVRHIQLGCNNGTFPEFVIGAKYLVYAFDERDELHISNCGPTKFADKALLEMERLDILLLSENKQQETLSALFCPLPRRLADPDKKIRVGAAIALDRIDPIPALLKALRADLKRAL